MTGKELENKCRNCKYLRVIVSQTSDYWCFVKNEYKNYSDFISNCKKFEPDSKTLLEKEEEGW